MATPSRASTPVPTVVAKAKPSLVPPPKAHAVGKPVTRGGGMVPTSAKSTPIKSPELKRVRRVTEVCDVHGRVVKNLATEFDTAMNEMSQSQTECDATAMNEMSQSQTEYDATAMDEMSQPPQPTSPGGMENTVTLLNSSSC